MFRRNALRPGAWLALLALAWSLLAPLAAQARAADPFEAGAARLDQALSLAICGAGGFPPGPLDDAPPPGTHQGGPACPYCQTGPAALPAAHGPFIGLPGSRRPLRLAPGPDAPPKGTWPPLPARGPPARA